MPATEEYRIIFYLSWSGVECSFEYGDKEKYDSARAFLDARLDASPMFGNGEPVLRAAYYYVEDDRRAAFEEYVRWSGPRGG